MSVYIVRLPQDGEAPAALVGIYVVPSPEALEREVTAVCAPNLCEYACVPHGCLYDTSAQEPGEGLYAEDERPARASDRLSHDWRELFFGAELPRWQPFGRPAWRSAGDRQDALATARVALALA